MWSPDFQQFEINMHECNRYENECLVCKLERVRGTGPQEKALTLFSFYGFIWTDLSISFSSLLSQQLQTASPFLNPRMQSSFSLLKTFQWGSVGHLTKGWLPHSFFFRSRCFAPSLVQMKTLENTIWISEIVVKLSGSSGWIWSASIANLFSQPQRSWLNTYKSFQMTENTNKQVENGFLGWHLPDGI